ncbi:MAG: hypothetical protein GY775_07930 [Candidatus Scalindua sp.]|nr:hypothetical protein [Candidatus Scalindua sp.]
MDGISAGNLLFGLNHAKSIEHKLNRFISKKDTNGDNALSIRELGIGKDVFDRIDKNGDGQADKFELIMASHKRAHAVNEKTNQVINEKGTNGDSVWNTGELGVHKPPFDRIDKNGDGQTGRGEHNIAAHKRAHTVNEKINQLIGKKDTNSDGVLNIGELGVPEKAFNRIDKNGDGQIGSGELNIAARNRIHAVNERINHLISKKDSNGNGVLDAGELGIPEKAFNRIDKDGNGQIGKFELNAAAHARAAINNLLGDILPDRGPSKLNATV